MYFVGDDLNSDGGRGRAGGKRYPVVVAFEIQASDLKFGVEHGIQISSMDLNDSPFSTVISSLNLQGKMTRDISGICKRWSVAGAR